MSTPRQFAFNVVAVDTSLPSWVPTTVGQSALITPVDLTLADGLVDDRFPAALDGVYLFAGTQNPLGALAGKLTDFSGGVYNRFYGQWGAHIIHGGGHSATEDNSVFLFDYNDRKFKRISGPTQLAAGTYTATLDASPQRELELGVPGSAHTYDKLVVLEPSVAPNNDPYGALIRPISSAVGVTSNKTTGWSHALTMSGTPTWSRFSTNASTNNPDGGSCCYDTLRQRIWAITNNNTATVSYFDCASRTWTNASTPFVALDGYSDFVYSAYHAQRDICVVATFRDGYTYPRFYWFAGGSSPATRSPVSFPQGNMAVKSYRATSIFYVPELQKIIYYNANDADWDAYYEVTVPSDPSTGWTWERKTIQAAISVTNATPAVPSSLVGTISAYSYKRIDYSPQLKSIVWVTGGLSGGRFTGRVFVIRVAP